MRGTRRLRGSFSIAVTGEGLGRREAGGFWCRFGWSRDMRGRRRHEEGDRQQRHEEGVRGQRHEEGVRQQRHEEGGRAS